MIMVQTLHLSGMRRAAASEVDAQPTGYRGDDALTPSAERRRTSAVSGRRATARQSRAVFPAQLHSDATNGERHAEESATGAPASSTPFGKSHAESPAVGTACGGDRVFASAVARKIVDRTHRYARRFAGLCSRRAGLRVCAICARAACCAVVAFLAAGIAPAHAENLIDAYREAVQHDPIVQQAAAIDRQGSAGVGIARGPLLPQLGVGAQLVSEGGGLIQPTGTQTLGSLTGPEQSLGGSGIPGLGSVRERQYSASLNQVLFDLGDIETLRASKAVAHANASSSVSAQQNLILRVARAYFTILTDEDQLRFDQSNAASQKQLRDEAKDRLHSGLTARMVVSDADAAYQQGVAQVLLDQNTLADDRRALAEITGQPTGPLAALGTQLPLDPPEPDREDAWVTQAMAANPTLAAQREEVASAQHSVAGAHAARLPTLTASVEYARDSFWSQSHAGLDPVDPLNAADALSINGRESGTTVGVVLTLPLFSGGTIHAQVRQALAKRDQAAQVLVQARRSTVTAVQNAFGRIETDIAIIKADERGVVSAKAALDSTEAGFRVGTDNITDVLVARSTYLQLLSASSRARHDLVTSRLALKAAAGALSVGDLEQANALLQ